ncbi:MAG TPA: antibiotic biosynthesis monooxygenase, partial [Gemmatimonadota bacterium]|nr:antibiotic biosynthesis monooxygenase [Gemmatimonadota bacterium]
AQDRPRLTGWDQDAWAAGLAYDEADAAQALEELATLRRGHVRLLGGLPDAALDRIALHEQRGQESVRRMMDLYAGHDLLHLRQIERIRRAVGARPRATGASRGIVSYVYVWRYEVPAASRARFEQVYGPDGDWVSLFRQADGYRSTRLLRDEADTGRYLTVDAWDSRSAHDAFRARFAEAYEALDESCASLTSAEELVGRFESLD